MKQASKKNHLKTQSRFMEFDGDLSREKRARVIYRNAFICSSMGITQKNVEFQLYVYKHSSLWSVRDDVQRSWSRTIFYVWIIKQQRNREVENKQLRKVDKKRIFN